MALTVSQAGNNYRTSSGSSVVVSSVTAAVGDVLVVVIGADNNGISGVSSISSVTDSASNSYTLQSSTTNSPSATAADGVTLAFYTTTLNAALNSGSVTVNLSPNTAEVGVLVWRVVPAVNERIDVSEVGAGATGTGTSHTITSGSVGINSVVIGGVGIESSSGTITGDSDTTNGTWSSAYQQTQSNIKVSSQYKAVTATATQTFNGTNTSSDWAANYLVLRSALRLYLPSTVQTSPPISPASDAGWEKTSEMDRALASTSKTNSAITAVTVTKDSTSTTYDMVRRQYLYGPLDAGTISGQALSVVRVLEDASSRDASSQFAIRVIAPDGTTVRGTALALSASALANEWPTTTAANRYFPTGTAAADLSSVSITAGDYLVIEYGVRARNNTASGTFTFRLGDPTGSDLANDQTGTTDNAPWLDLYGTSLPLLILNSDTDSAAANASEVDSISITATDTDNAAANVTETESLQIDLAFSDTDDNAANATETEDLLINLAVSDTDSNAANATEADAIAVEAANTDNNAANITEADALLGLYADTDSLAANVTETNNIEVTGDFAPLGLRVDVYDAADNKISTGPVLTILACSYEMGLDRVGAFSLAVPADSEDADLLALEREVRIYRESEGLVFRGIIARRSYSISADGKRQLDIAGDSIARQLVKRSTLLGLSFSGSTLAQAVGGNATANTLLYGTGWSAGSLATPSTTLLARYDGLSRWEALTKVAEVFSLHVREDNLNKEIDVIAAGTASGIVLQNVEQWTPELAANRGLFPVTQVGVEEQSQDLVNRLVPLGAGEGINQLTLRYSNRTTPYTVQNATGPDGSTYYYIEDATSVASYGVNERVVSVKEAIPLANSTSGYQAAANALYDVAATALTRSATPLTSYSVSVAGLRHVDNGAALFEPGQTMRLVYRGVTTDENGSARNWLDVDENLYLMGFSRSFDASGADSWNLTLTTADRFDVDPAGKLADTFSAVRALQVSLRYYTYHEVHILERTSIASGSTASMTVKWDGNVSLLHQAKLTFKVNALRSNVTVATASGGQEKTSSSGGGTTSSSSGSHSHNVSSSTSAEENKDTVLMPYWSALSAVTSGGPSTDSTQAQSASHTHSETGTTTGTDSVNHTHSLNSHTHEITSIYSGFYVSAGGHKHTVSGQTAESGGTHTHTVSAHTHTVTIDDHTHNLTYGIYTATAPTSPAIGIVINGTSRTVALGGPWNTVGSEVEVDITQYLQAASSEVPLQQSNEIVFSGAVLADVSAVLRSRVTASSLLPV